MKTLRTIFLVFISSLFVNAYAQEDEHPKAKWHVNKSYDEDGNLIAYDSVYVWSSHNMKHFDKMMNWDSLWVEKRKHFENFSFPEFDFSEMEELHESMQNLLNDFELPDFHFGEENKESDQKNYYKEEIDKVFKELKKEMDSLKEDFKKRNEAKKIKSQKREEKKV
jgi:hypothetical protein